MLQGHSHLADLFDELCPLYRCKQTDKISIAFDVKKFFMSGRRQIKANPLLMHKCTAVGTEPRSKALCS